MEVRIILKRILLTWLIVTALIAVLGKVTVAQSNAGQTTAEFLHVGPGARAAGMGNAYTAIADGSEAVYWNPAGVVNLDDKEVSFSHFSWFQGITVEHGAFAMRLDDQSALAIGITYFNYGSVQGYDVNGNTTAEIYLYDLAGTITYSRTLSEQVSVGLTGKFINSKIDELNGTAFAADFGVRYTQPKYALSAYFGNFGTKMKYDDISEKLPAVTRIGAVVTPWEKSFAATVEVEKYFDGNAVVKQGVQFGYNDQYFLRTGFNYYPDQPDRGIGSSLTFGAGYKLPFADIDYAYTPTDAYTKEDLHRFSIIFFLNN